MANDAERVQIVEVAPRDGLQNDPRNLTTAQKAALIDCLVSSGLTAIETTSFVNPKTVPKMADASDLMTTLAKPAGVRFTCLVPNSRGLERALAAGVGAIAIFASATEAFSKANTNCTTEEAFSRFEQVVSQARTHNVWIRGYVSVAFHCPYSGPVPIDQAVSVARRLHHLGCDEITLADTIGLATPDEIAHGVQLTAQDIPVSTMSIHVHDTHGRAIENVEAAYQEGIRIFDGSAGGLGGCPFAPGAPGNIATETLVRSFHDRGIETGVDLSKLEMCVATHLRGS